MSATAEHLDQVQRNEDLAALLLDLAMPAPEWAITILFYAAVHLVEAYLSQEDIHNRTHAERGRQMQGKTELAAMVALYRQLETDTQIHRLQACSGTLWRTRPLILRQAQDERRWGIRG